MRRSIGPPGECVSVALSSPYHPCFLGFGYDSTNLARRVWHQPHRKATIWRTTFGLSEVERGRIESSFDRDRTALSLGFNQQAVNFLRTAAVSSTTSSGFTG